LRRQRPGRKHAEKIKAELQAAGIHSQIVEARAGKDIRDHLDHGYTLFDLVSVEDQVPPAPEPGLDEGDIRHCFHGSIGTSFGPTTARRSGSFIPERRGVAIYSPAKIGKSLLMFELVVGTSRGTRC